MNPTTVKELIELAEKQLTRKGLAVLLDQHPNAITNWKAGRPCPYEVQATIAEAAGIDAQAWVWRQIQEARGKQSQTKSRLKKAQGANPTPASA